MTISTASDIHTLQASTHSPDLELSKVRSFDKQTEIFNILHSEDPSHYQRLWMAGFLKYAGYTLEEICDIIDKEASWNDYNAIMTYNQVRSIFRGSNASVKAVSSISSPSKSTWINRKEWEKIYNKPFCTIHYVKCSECPDHVPGHTCRGRV